MLHKRKKRIIVPHIEIWNANAFKLGTIDSVYVGHILQHI